MRVDPVFPKSPSVNLPRYKFVRKGPMIPIQDTKPVEVVQEQPTEESSIDSADKALLFSVVLLTLVVLFI